MTCGWKNTPQSRKNSTKYMVTLVNVIYPDDDFSNDYV